MTGEKLQKALAKFAAADLKGEVCIRDAEGRLVSVDTIMKTTDDGRGVLLLRPQVR